MGKPTNNGIIIDITISSCISSHLENKKNHPFELAQTHHVMFLPNYLSQTCYLIFLHKNPPRETPPTNGNPLYSQYIRGLPSPKGPKISNPEPQGPRVPGTWQGGYDMDLVFRQEIGQRLLPRLQQHLKRWAINVGGRNKTWRGCEGWEYLCTSLYIYIYIHGKSWTFASVPATTTMSHMIIMIIIMVIIMTIIRKKHIHTYLYICTCVCEIPHTEYAPHIHIDIIARVYLSIYITSGLPIRVPPKRKAKRPSSCSDRWSWVHAFGSPLESDLFYKLNYGNSYRICWWTMRISKNRCENGRVLFLRITLREFYVLWADDHRL